MIKKRKCRNMICISILRSAYRGTLDTSLRDVSFAPGVGRLNPCHAHVAFVEYNPAYDVVNIYLIHSEFPAVQEACCCLAFSPERARCLFPYLFVDTNPLLWRKL